MFITAVRPHQFTYPDTGSLHWNHIGDHTDPVGYNFIGGGSFGNTTRCGIYYSDDHPPADISTGTGGSLHNVNTPLGGSIAS